MRIWRLCTERWEQIKDLILKNLGLDVRKDRVVYRLGLRGFEVPRFKCVDVIGPYNPRPREGCARVVAGSAINLFERVDVLVTDLDHHVDLDKARYVYIVIHGDNYEKALTVNGQYITQEGPNCVPGFSDGEKAIVLASVMSDDVRITGFKLETPKFWRDLKVKEEKLRWIIRNYYIYWLREVSATAVDFVNDVVKLLETLPGLGRDWYSPR